MKTQIGGEPQDILIAVETRDRRRVCWLYLWHRSIDFEENITGHTALALAATKDDMEMAALLIGLGANVNYANRRHGYTPLMYCGLFDAASVAKLLLLTGADREYVNRAGDGVRSSIRGPKVRELLSIEEK